MEERGKDDVSSKHRWLYSVAGFDFELSRFYFSYCQPLGEATAFLGKATAKEDIAQPFVFGGSTSGICNLHPENICVLALGVPGRCRGEGGVSAL